MFEPKTTVAPHCLQRESETLLHQTNLMDMEKKIKRKELLHIVNKLYRLFTVSGLLSDSDLKLAIKISGAMHRWVTCEGKPGLDRAKLMSNCFVRHLMGTPLEQVPLSNRYKRLISKALSRSSGKTVVKVYWVSVFSVYRLYRLSPDKDTSTITSRFEGRLTGLFKWKYLSKLKTVKESFRFAVSRADQNWKPEWEWAISGAAGPNGPIAYTQYLKDLRALSINRGLGLSCLALFLSLPYVNKWEAAKALRDALIDSLDSGDENVIHSRLSFISDKGGKTRVIALGDILSQSILKTVHQRCNLILRHLPQDGTFDQDKSRMFIKKMSGKSLPLASIDLRAVTDRMPVLFQVFVLVHLRILTPFQALAWWFVTAKREFVIISDDGSRKYVRYAVGQPMGLMSSWPVMAISHHYLVRLSFSAAGFRNLRKAPYCVLGDDLSKHNILRVAEIYLDLISCLGMEYAPEKTYIASGVAEFAKSLFCHGEDLTPFPVALLRFNKNTVVSNVLAIMTECKRINLPLTASVLTGLHPKRWRNLVLLAALSPKSPRNALDLQPRDDQWIFLLYLFQAKVRYFSRVNTVNISTHAFALKNPGKSGLRLSSPYLQIGQRNGDSYPVRNLNSPEILLGLNWISYDTLNWPNGLPTIGDRSLVPGPTWKKERDDVIFRSSLTMFNKLMPNYFTLRCVGKQVGE